MRQTPSNTIHDVVVIGSGAGGGTVTKVLADLGISVLLMEAGRARFLEYISVLENVVADAMSAKSQPAQPIGRLRGATG